MNICLTKQTCQNFHILLDSIYKKSPFQKKRIEKYLFQKDADYFTQAEKFYCDFVLYLKNMDIPLEYAVDAYLRFCEDTLRHQIDFMKTGKYPMSSVSKAFEQIYNNDEKMNPYMLGLAVSLFLWKQHYEIFGFFSQHIVQSTKAINSYLEIGPGHGFYLKKALEHCPANAEVSVVDISKTSIRMTRAVMNYFYPSKNNITYYTDNIFTLNLRQNFDFITAGEIIEHLDQPEQFLKILKNLLSSNGSVFLSTCVNAPEVDHIFQFEKVEEIVDMLNKSGFKVSAQLVVPAEDVSLEIAMEKKLSVNYCAILNHL